MKIIALFLIFFCIPAIAMQPIYKIFTANRQNLPWYLMQGKKNFSQFTHKNIFSEKKLTYYGMNPVSKKFSKQQKEKQQDSHKQKINPKFLFWGVISPYIFFSLIALPSYTAVKCKSYEN